MVNYKLCSKCDRINFARVLYFLNRKFEKGLHQTMQIKNMYGNAKQGMDDKLRVQTIEEIKVFTISFVTNFWS
jgi:hypothetical protein